MCHWLLYDRIEEPSHWPAAPSVTPCHAGADGGRAAHFGKNSVASRSPNRAGLELTPPTCFETNQMLSTTNIGTNHACVVTLVFIARQSRDASSALRPR